MTNNDRLREAHARAQALADELAALIAAAEAPRVAVIPIHAGAGTRIVGAASTHPNGGLET